ncbi:MAG: hypothetical protein LBU98_06605 [Alistipes sp.]|jgi:hypothetical protein|nr:hypothetical protein [Alistipes sp.]
MMRRATRTAILCAAMLTAACTDHDMVDLPRKETSIVISDREYTPTRLLWSDVEIVYPPDEAAEEGLSIRIMADGANVTAEMPMRLVGSRIDLASRDRNPRPDNGVYFTFHISARAVAGDQNQPPGLFCRIVSWGTDDELDSGFIPYGGSLTVTRGETEGEWTVEWMLTDRTNGKTVSTGYVKNIFEKT